MEWQDPVAESGKLGRVLVVDDVAVVRKFIRTTLTAVGYDVVEAEDGEQALRILQGMMGPFPVDAILSDLRMPQINGAELIAYFMRHYPAIPVVVLTAYPDVELAVSLMRQGAMDFLVKPVLQDELLPVVRRAMEQQGMRKQAGHIVASSTKEDAMGLGRVLVVDDEADVRKSVRLVLARAGYDVVEAEDGEKAIAAIKADGNALLVDTIICDLFMPNVNGMEAIAYFRQQFPSVPVIVLTGRPNIPNTASLFKQGIADYLVKPVEAEQLTAAVNKAVREHILFQGQFAT